MINRPKNDPAISLTFTRLFLADSFILHSRLAYMCMSSAAATPTMTTSLGFLCSTCSTIFSTDSARRNHMSQPWHVYNMKRRIVDMPSTTFLDFSLITAQAEETAAQKAARTLRQDAVDVDDPPGDGDDDANEDSLPDSQHCLFCPSVSSDTGENVHHMAISHSFITPGENALQTDLDTFLAYLSLVVHNFHSCLYCGVEKSTAEGVQAHMIAKGHCMLDLRKSSDFREFFVEQALKSISLSEAQHRSDTDLLLPSGSLISSRHSTGLNPRASRIRAQKSDTGALVLVARTEEDELTPSEIQAHTTRSNKNTALTLSRRDQMGLIGLSTTQHRALAAVQKKLVAHEQRSKNQAQWTLEKGANKVKQHHFKVTRHGLEIVQDG